jgi:hypothetical protein
MNAISDQINFTVGYRGPTKIITPQGPLDVKTVSLIFKDAKTAISVAVPANTDTNVITLPFTCIRQSGVTHPDTLQVNAEKIQQLTLKTAFFDIPFEKPAQLEPGQPYCIVLSATSDTLKAVLDKKKSAQHNEDCSLVFNFFKNSLINTMILSINSFEGKVRAQSSDYKLNNHESRNAGSRQYLEDIFNNLTDATLSKLAGRVRSLTSNSLARKDIMNECIKTIGRETLFKTMQTTLGEFLLPPISANIQRLIDEEANSFATRCSEAFSQ